ncbi:MAG TPA: VWA domain-containing protein [Ktedonobacterales bacterium]|jgi:uncharacterized protein YegL|nr:VWA domain-containing protein [Ktedonobacterales bacterium]
MGSLDTRRIFEDMGEKGRRLPVYLMLDTSGSMDGQPIADVQAGVNTMLTGLRGLASRQQDTIYIKVIQFNDTVNTTPLTALRDFSPPSLVAGGTTHLGDALRVLDQATTYSGDLIKNTMDDLGDWKPMVFLLTDGDPTDDYQAPAAAVLKRTREHSTPFAPNLNVFAFGCGGNVRADILHLVTDNVLMVPTMTPTHMAELFKWMTATLGNVTRKITVPGAAEEVATEVPALPPFVIRS